MKLNFYHSTCNAVLALVSLFALGIIYGQSKTVQFLYQVIDSIRKSRDIFVWIPAPYSTMGRNQYNQLFF